ncbi:MAG: class II aldolase and adducin N-terminal domain-containing protein [Sulfurovum sp.]|nr:class II aldolase and adducin N-terminal domain-containing protein [Sulfurovum sp.]MCB4744304.1 class II aldolase and adducin N-terminal domain-containing protein [Sulfurovum sp.]MCB4746291.1 class II aldolase and adducin N-terminal domain-containing protein [Sulfurovum sp.]MCB4748721.1 class II aldolase and adducin N-terminal domain-containing protein [Sulfurovum sp.]MCB4750791.1 class II aldolase and adducin N-terminal domain-containing protein [Sulfurovum sp.]
MDRYLISEIQRISHSLFEKNFFGVYHGSISARVTTNSFIINSKDTILNKVTKSSLVQLDCQKRDYRWSLANSDVYIHEHIYESISNAKYISYTMPPYATAFSLKHSNVFPQDYYGKQILGEVVVYDPQQFSNWIERAPYEISKFFQKYDTHLLLIKGFGLIAYDRDITEMAKKIAILENSCRLLALSTDL